MKVNISFEEFKEFIVARCKENSACQPEFMRILSSENFEEILTVLKDNYNWCWNNSLFNAEEIKQIDNEVLIANGFYYDYNGVIDSKNTVYIYGGTIQDVRGNATIQDVRGNATIQNVWDNATIQNVWDNATIQNVWGNATIQNVWDNATIQNVWDNATIQNVWDNATIHNVWDNATIQNVWGNATIQNVWDNGLYKDYRGIKPKLYLKKNAFEIVLID